MQGSPAHESAVGNRPGDGHAPSGRITSYQFNAYTVAIPVFVNPSRQTLYPNEQVLLSVSDDWGRSDLYWDAAIVTGDVESAGYFGSVRGPFVTYMAPEDGQGQVTVTVTGKLFGRTGVGRDFSIVSMAQHWAASAARQQVIHQSPAAALCHS